jgi:hypothetical protein
VEMRVAGVWRRLEGRLKTRIGIVLGHFVHTTPPG